MPTSKQGLKKCKGVCHGKYFPYPSFPCFNISYHDGYCKIHHPINKRVRERDRIRKRDELWRTRSEGEA